MNVDISPDQARIAFSDSTGVQVLDAATGRRILYLSGHRDWVESVVFSPDGRRLMSGGFDNVAKIWDAQTGNEILTLRGHAGLVHSAVFSPDGKLALTASWDHDVKLWDAQTGKLLRTFAGHKKIVEYAVFDRDAKQILSCGYDKTAIVWDVATGRVVTKLVGHKDGIQTAFFSPDGKTILTGSFDHTAKLWDRATGRLIRTYAGHASGIHSAVFSPDGSKFVTASWDHTAKVWETATGKLLHTISHDHYILHAIFTPDGKRVLTGSYDKTLKLWDAVTGAELKSYAAGQDVALSCGVSPKKDLIALGLSNRNVIVVEPKKDTWSTTLIGHGGPVVALAWSPDGRRMLTGSTDNTARIWKIRSAKNVRLLRGHAGPVRAVAWSSGGELVATGSDDKTARIWSTKKGRLRHRLEGHAAAVRSVAFSPDGKRLLTGSDDGTLRLWDVATGKLIRSIDVQAKVRAVAFFPDGAQAIVGTSADQPQVRDLSDGRLVSTLYGHSGPVRCVSFAPDGRAFLTGSDDRSVIIWDAAARVEVGRKLQQQPLRGVAWFPDSRSILTAGENDVAVHDISREIPQRIRSRAEKIRLLAFILLFSGVALTAGAALFRAAARRIRKPKRPQQAMPRRRQTWFKVAAVVMAFAIAWPLFEVGLRVLLTATYRGQLHGAAATPASGKAKSLQLSQFLAADQNPTIAFRMRPGARGYFRGELVEINSMGFRDDPIEPKKPLRTIRVIGLGDSTMFGYGVAKEESYMELLEAEFNSLLRPGCTAEFINTGTPGYNTAQELELLLRDGLQLQPDAVIVQFDQNDLQTMVTNVKPDFLFSRVLLTAHLPSILTGAGSDAQAFYLLGQEDRLRNPLFPCSGWTAVETAYRELARVCRERDIPIFGLVVFEDTPPPVFRMPVNELHQRAVDLWRRIGITPIETAPGARNFIQDNQLKWVKLMNNGVDHYHPNRIGHAIIAQTVFPRIKDALLTKAGLTTRTLNAQALPGNIILRQLSRENMFDTEKWGGQPVNWTNYQSHFHFIPAGKRVIIPIVVNHPDVAPSKPVKVGFRIDGVGTSREAAVNITKPGYSTHEIRIDDLAGNPLEMTVAVNRVFSTGNDPREMGIAVYPLKFAD